MIRARIHAIACGYEDADDLDFLRTDPAFKLACGRLPETGGDLCSQPTLSRMENAPSLKDAIRLTYALVDQWIASVRTRAGQRHSRYRRHLRCRARPSSNSRCSMRTTTSAALRSIHVYEHRAKRPVAVVLRPGRRRRRHRSARPSAPPGPSISANAGPRRASPSGAMDITLGRGDDMVREERRDYVFGLPARSLCRKSR